MAKKLVEIAAEMRCQLAEGNGGYRSIPLRGGLEIVLSRAGEQWWLTLKRPDVSPSQNEVDICRRAFGVAEGAGERVFARRMLMAKTRELALFRGVEFSWQEVGSG